MVTALAVLVLVMMNFKNRDGAINAADATIEELLKCTAEDADTIVETLRLSAEDDTKLRDLFTARYLKFTREKSDHSSPKKRKIFAYDSKNLPLSFYPVIA